MVRMLFCLKWEDWFWLMLFVGINSNLIQDNNALSIWMLSLVTSREVFLEEKRLFVKQRAWDRDYFFSSIVRIIPFTWVISTSVPAGIACSVCADQVVSPTFMRCFPGARFSSTRTVWPMSCFCFWFKSRFRSSEESFLNCRLHHNQVVISENTLNAIHCSCQLIGSKVSSRPTIKADKPSQRK